MIIPIASDHAGYEAKKITLKLLQELGHTPVDFGTNSPESVDYPDFARQVSEKVSSGDNEFGILICGSGQGMCMTANKYPKVRAAIAYDEKITALTKRHNNANILCLPGRFVNEEEIRRILEAWFDTPFEGGRHQRRIDKIDNTND